MANVYGYIRISIRDQNEDSQLIALKEIGVTEGYTNKIKETHIRLPKFQTLQKPHFTYVFTLAASQ